MLKETSAWRRFFLIGFFDSWHPQSVKIPWSNASEPETDSALLRFKGSVLQALKPVNSWTPEVQENSKNSDGLNGKTKIKQFNANTASYAIKVDNYSRAAFETQVVCDTGSCCDGIYINRSCAWTNLYFYQKQFYAFVVNSSSISYDLHAVASGIRQFPQQKNVHPVFFPSIKVFESAVALNGFSTSFQSMTKHKPAVHLILSGGGHGNPAHAILDEVYSLWLCVCKFKLETAAHFVAISLDTGLTDGANLVNVEISRLFFGDMVFVKHMDPSPAYRFDLALAGVGQMGLSTPGMDYVTPGRSFDALKKLRNRFFHVYGHPPPIIRASSRRSDPLFVLLVPNKRDYNGILSQDMLPLVSTAGYETAYLDFDQLSYGERLLVYHRTDIMVTGVGTGATNGVFLSDGAVLVNLGTTERSGFLSFQEVSRTSEATLIYRCLTNVSRAGVSFCSHVLDTRGVPDIRAVPRHVASGGLEAH